MKCIMSSIHTCSRINQPCFQSKVTDFFPVVCLNARNTLVLVSRCPGCVTCDMCDIQGVLFGMKQAGINQGFWVLFLGLIPWFSTITLRKI